MNVSVAPTYSEKDVLEAARACRDLCGSLFAKQVIHRLGYDYMYQIPPGRRWLVISTLNLEARKEVERRREPAKKSTVNVTVNIDTKSLKNSASAVRKQIELMSGGDKDARSRRLRRGPFTMTPGTLRFGSRVETTDGRKGRVASICVKEGTCTRLVLVLDDCTTRIYEGVVNGFQIYSVGDGHIRSKPRKYASGGYVAHHQV